MTTTALVDLIEAHPFFAGMMRHDLERLATLGHLVDIAEGHLFFEGEDAAQFFCVLEGRVGLETFVTGRGPLTVDTAGPGEVVGWSWLFEPYRWHFDARALARVKAISFDAPKLRQLCETEPRIGYAITMRVARVMQRRLVSARLRLLDLFGGPA